MRVLVLHLISSFKVFGDRRKPTQWLTQKPWLAVKGKMPEQPSGTMPGRIRRNSSSESSGNNHAPSHWKENPGIDASRWNVGPVWKNRKTTWTTKVTDAMISATSKHVADKSSSHDTTVCRKRINQALHCRPRRDVSNMKQIYWMRHFKCFDLIYLYQIFTGIFWMNIFGDRTKITGLGFVFFRFPRSSE